MAYRGRRWGVMWALLLVIAALVPSASGAQVVPSVVVSPATDLLDGQTVSVDASGFPATTNLAVVECVAAPTTTADCSIGTIVVLSSDASGQLTVDYATTRVFFTDSRGRVDCAIEACVVLVTTLEPLDVGVVATAPISFQNRPWSVVVSPATELVDGQTVSVEASGFPASTTLAVIECPPGTTTVSDCGSSTYQPSPTDATGHLAVDYLMTRVILTSSRGRVDCAVEACDLVVATADEAFVARAPISFQNTPLPPRAVELQLADPHYQEAVGVYGTTLRARMTCATTAEVTVWFRLRQTTPLGGTPTGDTTITVPCTSGGEVLLLSDLLDGFESGAAEAIVFASIAGQPVDAVVEPITIQPHAVVLAELQDRIATDPDAFAELLAAIEWRLTYNPEFGRRFFRAILRSA